MPSLGFVLPHWLYWTGLLFFPLLAWRLTARQLRRGDADGRPSLFIAYMFWLLSGYLGIHRFYLRSLWGFVFIPVFAAMLYCNVQVRAVRDDTSRTFAALESAQRAGDTAALAERKRDYDAAAAVAAHWSGLTRDAAILLAVLLAVDGVLLPRAVRRRRALETSAAVAPVAVAVAVPDVEGGVGEDPTLAVRSPFTDVIDRFSTLVGRYVAWWSLIAVFAYYYEVLARYVFNSPTNWVHESMFLMFGMQYMLSGAIAYREDQHVRVDVLYVKLPPRGRAIADIVTSVFFFIFVLTMLWTGARFALDAINVGEHSFTEWGVQYWPVKLTIPVGAALLALQGLSKLIKDVMIVMQPQRPA